MPLIEFTSRNHLPAHPYFGVTFPVLRLRVHIPGIGIRTAQYIAMRTMGYTDAFLETDAGIKKALEPNTSKELPKTAEAWSLGEVMRQPLGLIIATAH
ncbi:MAG: hypothetical protein LBQ73_08740 [Tannerellaceae bacterium]|nr:hypothetical protein [Tannerellaceae bacterium]